MKKLILFFIIGLSLTACKNEKEDTETEQRIKVEKAVLNIEKELFQDGEP